MNCITDLDQPFHVFFPFNIKSLHFFGHVNFDSSITIQDWKFFYLFFLMVL